MAASLLVTRNLAGLRGRGVGGSEDGTAASTAVAILIGAAVAAAAAAAVVWWRWNEGKVCLQWHDGRLWLETGVPPLGQPASAPLDTAFVEVRHTGLQVARSRDR